MRLQNLRSLKDLKHCSPDGLNELAADIRRFLIESISVTGGHLASNLGVVELTLALHAVYDSPRDKIIWDVGHQSYVHKILTGRIGRFNTLRQLDGLSGYPKPAESEHDAFATGHASTSISAALGLCAARDLSGGTGHVTAVVGDGAMTGGLAYEALNNAGRSNTDILVIVNDNQMSIAENVGAISRHLNDIRTAPFYLDAKHDVHKILDRVPLLGKPAAKLIENAKDAVKYILLPGVMFEELGFQYFGPVDGHDIRALTDTLKKIKQISGPVMLHVLTVKGKGYNHSEHAPVNFHGVDSFSVDTGEPKSEKPGDTYTDVFSRALLRQAQLNEKIVAITAAMPDGTGLCAFKQKFPGRFFDVGIAEGHAVTFAAGLAKGGTRPVVAVYSSFLQRAYDQLLHDVCLQNLPVVFAVDRAGVVGPDGETHQGLYDLSFLSHMPNMTVMAPRNRYELNAMLCFALSHDGPCAIRYPRSAPSRAYGERNSPLFYGRSETLEEGEKIAILSVGAMFDTAARAADILRGAGYNPGLYNARFVKPIDMELTAKLGGYAYVFTIEDGARTGGYGARILETLAASRQANIPYFHNFAFPDVFPGQGTRAELFKRYRLDADSVAGYILDTLTKTN